MYHTMEMIVDYAADLEMSQKQPLERVLIQQGARLRAQIRPHVIEGDDCPIEVADFFFEDGILRPMTVGEFVAGFQPAAGLSHRLHNRNRGEVA